MIFKVLICIGYGVTNLKTLLDQDKNCNVFFDFFLINSYKLKSGENNEKKTPNSFFHP